MSESELDDLVEDADSGMPRQRQFGRFWRSLWSGMVFLTAVTGLSLGGYLYWQSTLDDPSALRIAQLVQSNDILVAEIEELKAVNESRTASTLAELESTKKLAEDLRREVVELARAETDNETDSPRRWRLAETEYLMRVANEQLRIWHDHETALHALSSAQDLLGEIDSFYFTEVRELLAKEIQALQAMERLDVQKIFFELEALKDTAMQLPLRLPNYIETRENSNVSELVEDPSTTAKVLAALGNVFTFRTAGDEEFKPVPSVNEAHLVQQRIVLALERAQLALMRRDQALFELSIDSALQVLESRVDRTQESASRLHVVLVRLKQSRVSQAMPSIQESLERLRELRSLPSTPER